MISIGVKKLCFRWKFLWRIPTALFKGFFCLWPIFDVCILLESEVWDSSEFMCQSVQTELLPCCWLLGGRASALINFVFIFEALAECCIQHSGLQSLWLWLFFLNANSIVFWWRTLILTSPYIRSSFKANLWFCVCSFCTWKFVHFSLVQFSGQALLGENYKSIKCIWEREEVFVKNFN